MNPNQPKSREPGEGQDPELQEVQAMFEKVRAQTEKDIKSIEETRANGEEGIALWALGAMWHLPPVPMSRETPLFEVVQSRVKEALAKEFLSPASAAHLMRLLEAPSDEDRGYNVVLVYRFLEEWKETQACQKGFVMEEMLKEKRELILKELQRQPRSLEVDATPLVDWIEHVKARSWISKEVAALLLKAVQGPAPDDREKYLRAKSVMEALAQINKRFTARGDDE